MKKEHSLVFIKPVKELYETAGIKSDFSEKYVKELMDFVREELEKIK